uniref:Multifunctional methyltransferase subunit TRM112-like protein n=2 Tax=Leptobrachium leishanense TaxID=445787 RepID=A0A8C5QRI0_9ANUR
MIASDQDTTLLMRMRASFIRSPHVPIVQGRGGRLSTQARWVKRRVTEHAHRLRRATAVDWPWLAEVLGLLRRATRGYWVLRKMKLLTHNMLRSHVTGVTRDFPLLIRADEVKINVVDFNRDFVARMIPKLEWGALVGAAESLGHASDLPQELPSDYENKEELLKKVHHVLLEVEVIEGALKCPESGTEFPITRGEGNPRDRDYSCI